MYDVSQDLHLYASNITIGMDEVGRAKEDEEAVYEEERNKLIRMAHAWKRNRLQFFNNIEGIVRRLSVRGKSPKLMNLHQYCTLCGQNRCTAFRGHRRTYSLSNL